MKQIQAPNKLNLNDEVITIFLAGSIEMGKAEKWQDKVIKLLEDRDDIIIFNPRRDDWDSSWVQSKDNPHFREQVEWELDALTRADRVLMYFDPNTKSPISLLELGLFANKPGLIVICPEGFWKKGKPMGKDNRSYNSFS